MGLPKRALVPVIIVLGLLVAFSTLVCAADDFRTGYELGMEQGKTDSPMINILWGIVGGVIAFGVVAFTPPADPSAVRMMELEGMSADYKAGYLEGYASGRQQMRYIYTGGGALLNVVALFLGIGGLI
jgi:hypothetical protein